MRLQGSVLKTGLLALLLSLSAVSAFADFAGNTTGYFSSNTSSNLGTNVLGLQFNRTASFASATSPIALGSFSFTNPPLWPSSLSSYDFTLNVTFTQPGNGISSFAADIKGVVGFGLGVAYINFDPNTQRVDYGSGSFYLTLNDIVVYSGATANIVGTINPNPEPSSVVLISTVLGGAYLLFRRSNKRALPI